MLWLKRIGIILCFSVVLVLCGSFYKIILVHDISLEPIDVVSTPEVRNAQYQSRPRVYLVSYVDGHEVFYQNQNHLMVSGLNKGIDFFLNYKRSHLDAAFYEKHKAILTQKRGAGYWLWKPWVIYKTLLEAPENALIIYADSGVNFLKSVTPLLAELKGKDILLVENMGSGSTIRKRTQRATLEKLNCTRGDCLDRPLVWAAFAVFRNTPTSRAFVKEWLEGCCDEKNITDYSDGRPEDKAFQGHHYDQSILSILAFQHQANIKIISYNEAMHYTTWNHRHPHKAHLSLLPKLKKGIRGWERKILNMGWFPWVKKALIQRSEV